MGIVLVHKFQLWVQNGVRGDENSSDLPETSEEGESVVLLGAERGYDRLYADG